MRQKAKTRQGGLSKSGFSAFSRLSQKVGDLFFVFFQILNAFHIRQIFRRFLPCARGETNGAEGQAGGGEIVFLALTAEREQIKLCAALLPSLPKLLRSVQKSLGRGGKIAKIKGGHKENDARFAQPTPEARRVVFMRAAPAFACRAAVARGKVQLAQSGALKARLARPPRDFGAAHGARGTIYH